MKVFILGSRGNLGSVLTEKFTDNRFDVINDQSLDLLNFESILSYLDNQKPDIIINSAAYNTVDLCENNQDEFNLAYKLNCALVKELAVWSLHNKSILIHYSSDYVFGGENNKREFSEADACCPVNKYGQTKADGERELINLSKYGLKYFLIRTSKLFGPRGKSTYSKKSFFDIIAELANNKDKLQIVNEELGCFTYTPDLAEATLTLLKNKYLWGIYHVTNSNPATWYDAALELKSNLGFKADLEPVSGKFLSRSALRPKYSVLVNNKLPELRGYQSALKEYIKNKQ